MNKYFWMITVGLASACLFVACGPSLQGIVVMPDGSKLNGLQVTVYTKPWTDSVQTKDDGSFKISKNVEERNKYTLIAEDKDGNMGYVKGYDPLAEADKKIVIKLSREMDAKDAVMEGDVYNPPNSGHGEKIFKSSQ